jgi:D-alanyl-D-alanine dipeptidase
VKEDFAFVDELVPGIRWDAEYATWDNFTGRPVDGCPVNRIVGTRALGAALGEVWKRAGSLGFGLLIRDGHRPQRAVDSFVLRSRQPEDNRTKSRHCPNIERSHMFARGHVAAKSGHSRGSTVDMTLYHLDSGELAATGGRHDLVDVLSHHGAAGIEHVATRKRAGLRSLMEECGFRSYACEWWHCTLKHEPCPDTYFDFSVVQRRAASNSRHGSWCGLRAVGVGGCHGYPPTWGYSESMSKIFRKSFEVRWDDVDVNGHMRSTRYLEYAGTARLSFLKAAGWDVRALQKDGFSPILLGEEVRYLREVFLAEEVTVSCEVVGLSADRARWRMQHSVIRESGEEAAAVRSLGAWIDVRARKITAPPAGVGDAFEAARSDDCEVIGAQP